MKKNCFQQYCCHRIKILAKINVYGYFEKNQTLTGPGRDVVSLSSMATTSSHIVQGLQGPLNETQGIVLSQTCGKNSVRILIAAFLTLNVCSS